MEDDPGLKKNRPSLTNCSNRFQILTQNRLRSPVAAAMLLLLCVFFASSASAAKPPTSANGTRTVEGKLNALINGALSLPVSGERGEKSAENKKNLDARWPPLFPPLRRFQQLQPPTEKAPQAETRKKGLKIIPLSKITKKNFVFQPSYLPATTISAGPSSAAISSSNATSSLECFKRCAVSISANSSLSCYGATFAPATGSCALFSAAAAGAGSPTPSCPALVLEANAAASSALFPSRYSKVAEACITSGPLFKDGPSFEVPTPREGADAAAGIVAEAAAAAVFQGATIFESGSTLSYLGSVARMASPAVCTGLCLRYKLGANWTATPTNFSGTWAAAAGYIGVPQGVVTSECVAVSHYNAAAAYQEADNQFEYVCDLWGAPPAGAGTLASVDLQPQEPGGRNSASVLLTSRWKALPRV